MIITFLASYLIWVLFAGVIYLWVIDGRVKKEVALHAILAYLVGMGLAEVLKNVFHTTRPFVVANLIPLTASVPHDGAFPSAHTTAAIALAVTVWLHDKKLGTIFVVLAILVGLARILALVHWPIDILAGVILGSLVAIGIEHIHPFNILRKISKR
jgi:undecaprenyl-diphosphatase